MTDDCVPVFQHAVLQQPLPSLVSLLQHNAGISSDVAGVSQVDTPRESHTTPVISSAVPTSNVRREQSHEEIQGPPLDRYHFRDDALRFSSQAALTNDDAVLDENELSIGIQPNHMAEFPELSVTQSHIEKGVMVLTLLKDFPATQRYLDKWFSYGGGFILIEPVVKIYLHGIWSTWQKTIEGQKPEDLRRMSEVIWDNTLKPVSRLFDEHTKPREFFSSVTGTGLRWEVVGVCLGLVSMCAQSMKGE